MADSDHVARIKEGVAHWNSWRLESSEKPDLSEASLSGSDLSGANLNRANLSGADLEKPSNRDITETVSDAGAHGEVRDR